MSETDEAHGAPPERMGRSPAHIRNPELRFEAMRALVWAAVAGLFVLAVYISQSLLVIFGAMVFATMIDGGTRLLGRYLAIARGWRVAIVIVAMIAFFVWLGYFAGSQISQQAAEFPAIIGEQIGRLLGLLREQGFAIQQDDVQDVAASLVSGVGTVTRAIGGIFGGFATILLILIIGIYIAIDPNLYERGVAWMVPAHQRKVFHETLETMSFTLRRLLAGRLVGMFAEGIFTWALLAYGGQIIGIGPVPMAALLGLLTGLLAFIPNIGALISGALMVLVGFSGGTDMGLYTIFVYLLVQNFDGYVLIPMIAKKTVDLAPALVLGAQLIFGVMFGILGLALADPLLAMIKVGLERRAARLDNETSAEAED
ncbi:AI-2E family transporter [Pelagerythrobacter marinus]|uniref:AI-2E family transporter n=1 Tax=Pelagerythrobacter marinus TaxID=538382 RepID=UPI002AC93DF4|nr:AI-2E family transporter [Pelagerythrobacter marinus]MEC9067073.1 AI-2E family transporter [Pseudomonadota bacterium]WPZ07661.1 AI-2E family transporter [Pelagerythrobacter marinus]